MQHKIISDFILLFAGTISSVVFASIFVYPNIEIEYLMISGTNRIKLVWLDFHSEKYNNSYVEVCVLMVIAHGLSWETFRLF